MGVFREFAPAQEIERILFQDTARYLGKAKRMDNIGDILSGLAALAWPALFLVLLLRFSPSISKVIQSAVRRKFTIKVGGNELTMEEVSEQQRLLINDIQEQLVSLQKHVEQTGGPAAQGGAAAMESTGEVVHKILWVDDYPGNNASIIAHLSDLGVDVTTALSTKEGLRKFSAGHYDAVLSDMGRREGGENNHRAGVDLARQIREIDSEIPFFIFCSRRGKARSEEEALRAGANGVTTSGVELLRWLSRIGTLGKLPQQL